MPDSSQTSPQTAEADLKTAQAHGLTDAEFTGLCQHLQRPPNLVELGIVSAMWSEHCSYKSSRQELRKFPTSGPCVIQGPGENAGIVDIGDGQAAVFKMESHNHPSYIEPFQGAATGVGGILRDIFTMGARPIALLNALRFGDPSHPKTRGLISGVVSGISHYGNCVGVPNIGGETQFDASYNGNILVNVMAVGLVRHEAIFYARGASAGLPVLYVGARTGRDGVHGASMASAEFSADAEQKRPTVQVGDPFAEKRLIEACLELMAQDCIVAVQDMGAAGLTSSSVEMADKGGIGIALDLDHVPLRETQMSAYDIMLSESQERMLMVLKTGTESLAQRIFSRWELTATPIGQTDDSGRLRLTHHGQCVCDLPVSPLVDKAPIYSRPADKATRPKPSPPLPVLTESPCTVLTKLMSSPDMCCKSWIWEQYDRHVMADTLSASGIANNAGCVRIHGTNKALALSSDCTPRYVKACPETGGKQAVAESFRNLVCAGAKPLAITNNLNFGNPERPAIMGQLSAAIDGMAEACRVLEYPVVSGNVSLYNETDGTAIAPTPVIGGLGLIEDISVLTHLTGAQAGDVLLRLGAINGHLACSLYARDYCQKPDSGPPPPIDLFLEKAHAQWVLDGIKTALFHGVNDVSDGGMACAAAEMALKAGIGVALDPAPADMTSENWYFGEDQASYLLAVNTETANRLLKDAPADLALTSIGRFGGDQIDLGGDKMHLSQLRHAYHDPLPTYMEGQQTSWP